MRSSIIENKPLQSLSLMRESYLILVQLFFFNVHTELFYCIRAKRYFNQFWTTHCFLEIVWTIWCKNIEACFCFVSLRWPWSEVSRSYFFALLKILWWSLCFHLRLFLSLSLDQHHLAPVHVLIKKRCPFCARFLFALWWCNFTLLAVR